MFSKRTPWFIAIAVILVFGILFFLGQNQLERALLEQAQSDLSAIAQEKAIHLGQWQNDLSMSLLNLAEQREIREGVARLITDQSSSAWREGFMAAFNGCSRGLPGISSLALRDLSGFKIAGAGADHEAISYPEPNLRFVQQRISAQEQRIIVPVRDPRAVPLAYLMARVESRRSQSAIVPGKPSSDLLLCLADSTGERIWNSDSNRLLPIAGQLEEAFALMDGKTYLLAYAEVAGSGWTLCVARERDEAMVGFQKQSLFSLVSFGIAAILLILPFLIAARRLS
jgi:hypothetical protein